MTEEKGKVGGKKSIMRITKEDKIEEKIKEIERKLEWREREKRGRNIVIRRMKVGNGDLEKGLRKL